MSIIFIILLVILSTFLLIQNIKQIKLLKLEKLKEEEKIQQLLFDFKEKEKENIDNEILDYRNQKMVDYLEWLDRIRNEQNITEERLVERKQAVEEIIEQLELRRREAEIAYQKAILNGQEKINIELDGYRKVEVEKLNNSLASEFAEKRQLTLAAFNEYSDQLAAELAKARDEQLAIIEELEEYKKKRAAYNAEILRRRELEEKQDFYRVVLSTEASDDISYLLSIREKLIYRENLDKLIYDVYISKQVNEMIKRVLKGAAPSGIYKITRIKTGEIYIGKSTDIKKRWTEHCKTAYGVGTIAHSVLHTTIKKDGIENFTFELLEEVPKDKLTEREKYWITFYDSKNYGLNERNG